MDGKLDYMEMLSKMSHPARSALLHEGIDSYVKLAQLSEKEFLSLHGIGKASLPVVNHYLKMNRLSFLVDQK